MDVRHALPDHGVGDVSLRASAITIIRPRAKGAGVMRVARKRTLSPRCLFCRAQTDWELWDFPVCEPCTVMFWAFVERMCASGERMRCEGCGDPARKIVDGHLLCGDCYAPVAKAVSDATRMLGLRGTRDQISALPESDEC